MFEWVDVQIREGIQQQAFTEPCRCRFNQQHDRFFRHFAKTQLGGWPLALTIGHGSIKDRDDLVLTIARLFLRSALWQI
jgi:hypothetical protein